MSESPSNRTKIEIHSASEDMVDIETPWVEQLDSDQYRLLNLPVFAYGLSLGDVVKAEETKNSSLPVFRHVVQKSGHRLLRAHLDAAPDGLETHMDHFKQLGCFCEPYVGESMGIDVPPDVPLGIIAEYLLDHSTSWEFANPTYSTLYRSHKSLTVDPLHTDPSQLKGAYDGYFCSESTGMVTSNDSGQRLGRVAIRVAFYMLMHESGDFMWICDKNDLTFQFVKKPEGEFWCEYPVPERNGSLGTTLSSLQLNDLLRQLPTDLEDLKKDFDFELHPW